MKALQNMLNPINEVHLESKILRLLSHIVPILSNELREKLNVNNTHFTKIRNKMIEEGWIRSEKRQGRLYLTRIDFRPSKFDRVDWTSNPLINCSTALVYLKKHRPIFRITRNGLKIKPEAKESWDMLFDELDKLLIIHTRLVYARSLGLIPPRQGKSYQLDCINAFNEIMTSLLSDHLEFKNEITEHVKSQLKTFQFKI